MADYPWSSTANRMKPSAIRAMTRLAAAAGSDLITLAGGMPNPKTFALERLAQIASEQILRHAGKNLQYGMTIGYRPLVSWIASYCVTNHVNATIDNVVCTAGSQQAIDLITEVLINEGDFILLEIPTYSGALAVFRKTGADLIGVQQDDAGIVPDDLESKLKPLPREKTKLIYVISNFQNPSGVSIARDRRQTIVQLLNRYDAYLIEDDPYGEIYFDESKRPCEPIKRWGGDRVFYLGTFSKLVAPTFRTGWVVAAEPFARKIELAREAADLCGSLLDQRIVHSFCSMPEFSGHLQMLRSFYAERHAAMVDALQEYMPEEVTWTKPAGGFFVWVKLPDRIDSETFLQESISTCKVSYIIGRAFAVDDSCNNYLRLAYSVEEPERIREGVKRLSGLIRRFSTLR